MQTVGPSGEGAVGSTGRGTRTPDRANTDNRKSGGAESDVRLRGKRGSARQPPRLETRPFNWLYRDSTDVNQPNRARTGRRVRQTRASSRSRLLPRMRGRAVRGLVSKAPSRFETARPEPPSGGGTISAIGAVWHQPGASCGWELTALLHGVGNGPQPQRAVSHFWPQVLVHYPKGCAISEPSC